MATVVEINGVDRIDLVRDGTLEADKYFGVETLTLETWDRGPVSGAFLPVPGQTVYVEHDGYLIFGGEISEVDAQPIINDLGTRVTVVATDYTAVFETIVITQLVLPAGDLLVNVATLFAAYLAGRGYTNISAGSGGPTVAELDIEYGTLGEVLSRYAEDTGWFYRANGDQQFEFAAPGSNAGPVTLSVANGNIRERGFGYRKSRLDRATRLFLRTGTPAAGAGPYTHRENWTANGVQTVFPCNVESLRKRAVVNHAGGYSAGASAMDIDGLYPSKTLKTGNTFRVAGAATTYTLTGDATGTDQGQYTIAFTPGLAAAVEDDAPLVFGADTFVALEVGGTPTALGSTWTFDPADNAFTKATGGAPANGTVITKVEPILFPAMIRVWDASLLLSDGSINADAAVDAVLEVGDITDVGQAADWGREELARRVEEPWRVVVLTDEPGFYPLQEVTLSIPDRDLTGTFLIERQRCLLNTQADVTYELTLVEGERLGKAWFEYFKKRRGGSAGAISASGSTAGGSTGGGTGGGGTGTGAFPEGHTIHFGGDNYTAFTATTSWQNWPHAIPTRHGSASPGSYELMTPMFLLSAGTLEARLIDQAAPGTPLATTSTTTVSTVAAQGFDFPTDTYTEPSSVKNVLLQFRVTSGTIKVVLGHASSFKV
jgi:hypothetical protein